MDSSDKSDLPQAIALTVGGFLGGADSLRSVTVELFPQEMRSVVWVELIETTVERQLEAVDSFFAVQEIYLDDVEVSLRFGAPDEVGIEQEADVKVLQFAA